MTVWKQWESWTYEYFELDEEASTFTGAESFVELWNDKRGNHRVPMWSDYDWDDLALWWGSIVVSDLVWDPFDSKYRLFGTNVASKFDVEVTGMLGSQLNGGSYVAGPDMEFYEMAARNLYFTRVSGPIHWQNREYVHVTFVELPLSDTGERGTHGLALMI